MIHLRLSALVSVYLLSAFAVANAEDGRTSERDTAVARVSVDFSSARPISPYLFGQNIEYINSAEGMWDSETANVRPELIPPLRDLKTGILRFPGGTLSNYYHWADGIGPHIARGKGCPDWEPQHAPCIPMTFGTDEFFLFTQTIGCPAAIFTVNVPTETDIDGKSWMGTAQEAAAWVAYCNATPDNQTPLGKDLHGKDWGVAGDWAEKRAQHGHPAPCRVQFWELGNEIFTTQKDPVEYAGTCRDFSRAMKAVDPSIQIGVVGNDLEFGLKKSPWNETVLKETRGDVDFLVAHFYLPGIRGGGDGDLTAKDTTRITLVSPDGFRRKLSDLQEEIIAAGLDANFGVAVTEFACNLQIDAETDSRRLALIRSQQAAVYVADTLLAFQEAGVLASNYWALRSWEWSLIDHVQGKDVLQGPYFVYKLFADHWQECFCSTTVQCGNVQLNLEKDPTKEGLTYPSLTAGASIHREQAQAAVMLINRATDGPTTVEVHLKGMILAGGDVLFNVLTAPADGVNSAEFPEVLRITHLPVEVVGPAIHCRIPPCSVGVVTFAVSGK